jgi:hypothetical protein
MPSFNPLELGQNQWVPQKQDKPDHKESGHVDVIIVPSSDGAQPVPNLELIHVVETFLRKRCPPTVALRVAGPAWTQVTVTAEIVPASLDAADALTSFVEAALRRFLHPLHGGPDGRGWAFGRRPHQSDLYAMIEGLPGVEYVHTLNVDEVRSSDASDQQARTLIYSGDHDIRLVAG